MSSGRELARQGRWAEAADAFRQAIRQEPPSAQAQLELSVALHRAGRRDAAIEAIMRAITIAPRDPAGYIALGHALAAAGSSQRAVNAFRTAAQLGGSSADLVGAYRWVADLSADWRAIPGLDGSIPDPSPFYALYATTSPATLLASAKRQSARIAADFSRLPPASPRRTDRIRIGYISEFFHTHPTLQLMVPVLERHDTSRFAVSAYCLSGSLPEADPLRTRLAAAVETLVPLADAGYEAAARRIQQDDIDILVDLDGHMGFSSSRILAQHPATIQVSLIGFPGSSGADFIDYIIADEIVAPRAEQGWFSEQIVHLPDSYLPGDVFTDLAGPPSRASCGLPETGFVFCCFNQAYKIRPELFDLWMRLLIAHPDSVLWLYSANPVVSANLRREAQARGAAPDRLIFARDAPYPQHLARHQLADLFLDTLPYNAHSTASIALRAGIPVLTCRGATFPGRVGASLLHAIGLPELIAHTLADYEALAGRLVRAPDVLQSLRSRLAVNRRTAPLFNPSRYAAQLEHAFARMVSINQTHGKPLGFSIQP